ncbi:hypothetical protein DPV78_008482 [Talaromyces pinophilus]|nr:hypothetical protein DPV78_008482 [Talaromyces pinophilus]
MLTNYHNLGRECPQAYFDTWFYYNETIIYPPQQGFKLDSNGVQIYSNITIPNGTYIDRFGRTDSQYVSPAGVPYEKRSIPPSNLIRRHGNGTIYVKYVTLTDIEVENGTIAPWFGQPGGGIQYILPYSTETLANPPYNWLEQVALV